MGVKASCRVLTVPCTSRVACWRYAIEGVLGPCIDRALHFTCRWSTSRLFARVPLCRPALQFKELMEQIETGDADQKAYAAMELQTMALDSRSQAPI